MEKYFPDDLFYLIFVDLSHIRNDIPGNQALFFLLGKQPSDLNSPCRIPGKDDRDMQMTFRQQLCIMKQNICPAMLIATTEEQNLQRKGFQLDHIFRFQPPCTCVQDLGSSSERCTSCRLCAKGTGESNYPHSQSSGCAGGGKLQGFIKSLISDHLPSGIKALLQPNSCIIGNGRGKTVGQNHAFPLKVGYHNFRIGTAEIRQDHISRGPHF